jgi:predicted TPR repeat methyltransferase
MSLSLSTDWSRDTLLFDKPHDRLRLMARLLAKHPLRRLLDVGCSTGVLRSLLPADFDYHGCDLAPHAALRLPPDRFRQVDLNGAGLTTPSDWKIDIIHMGGVLEYMREPGRILRQARALVAQRGALVLSIVNFRCGYWSPRRCHPTTVYRPSLDELLQLLDECGWRTKRIVAFRPSKRWPRRLGMWLAQRLGAQHPWTQRWCHQYIVVTEAA